MKIVYLAAGAANMVCGSCLHDNTLAAALLAAGEDVLLVPTYTPLRTDEHDVSQARVFLGGINVYLQQKSAIFRHTPWFLDRWLDSPGLIRWATSGAASIDPAKLGDLTVSMLAGEEGRQRKEVAKLIHWLEKEVRPDIVHLSNSMLSGLAKPLRERLRVPVVCGLSGEDIFLERLTEPHYSQARELLRRQASHVDAFVALNAYFADYMAEYLASPREQIRVIPHGVQMAGHGARTVPRGEGERTIGYLSRVCPEKGLHVLAEAFKRLSNDASLPPVRLRAAGYLADEHRPYLETIQTELQAVGLGGRFEYAGEPDRRGKIAFLQSLDVLSVPTVYRESKGLAIIEAWANAVPVVQPAHGAFPELIADTGGGLLCRPEDPQSLADALRRMIVEPAFAEECGRRGHEAVRTRYNAETMARNTLALYRQLTVRS